ncbi:MAG: DNA-packaging protein [Rhodospirillales bacterium]|nr:DNA-packaging protein [Rhodospirillales bacterium]
MTVVDDTEDLRWLLDLSFDEFEALLAELTPLDREDLLLKIEALAPPPEPWKPLAHQVPPSLDDKWYGWLLLGGRGSGKTAAVTHMMNDHALGPPCFATGPVPHRMGIIAPTLGDASASIVHGDDGLAVINPDVREVTRKGGTVALWPNGAVAHLFGVHTRNDVDRLRAGGNRCFDLREEVAAWRYLADGMTQADLGLRRGIARWIGATTPRSRPTIRKLDASPLVKVSRATTNDNPYLSELDRQRLYDQFGNTSVGLQELEGQIIDEVDGALWHQELIDQYRVLREEVPRLRRVRTYVDPSWGTKNDECGIIVCGLGVNGHVYILGDLSKRTTPEEWAMIAAIGRMPRKSTKPGERWVPEDLEPRIWHGRVSERVVAEKNFQGEQVKMAMKLASRELDRRIIFGWVNSSQGKRLRAEPVHLLYEQGRVHHVGQLPGLEFQMTSWIPPEAGEDSGDPGDPEVDESGETGEESSKWSPDRLDACVFGCTDLALGASAATGHLEIADGRVPRVPIESPRGPAKPQVGRIPTSVQERMVRRQLGRPPSDTA